MHIRQTNRLAVGSIRAYPLTNHPVKGPAVGLFLRYPFIGHEVRSSSTAMTSAALVTPLASNTPSAPS